MPSQPVIERLNQQIGYEFAASQQYVAIAAHYDRETLPRLAAFFFAQAVEERNHAMMFVQHLLDSDAVVTIPATPAPQSDFADLEAPVALALDQERQVSAQIDTLASLAREHSDHGTEQFMQWFIKEQVEEVSTMSDLLTVVRRCVANPMMIEEYLAREQLGGEGADPTAPPAAGGAP